MSDASREAGSSGPPADPRSTPLEFIRLRLNEPPPGPFRPPFWKSPLRGPWLTSLLGALLVPGILIMLLTGLISHWGYHPEIAGRNATSPQAFDIPVLFQFPASWPSWDYAVTQGLHTTLGLMLIPLVLSKLWSVIPRLFAWPAAPQSPAAAIERLSILVLVASMLMEFVTGTLDVQYWYAWKFNYYTIHYYGAWVFFSAFTVHFLVKLPVVVRSFRDRGVVAPLRDDLAATFPEPMDADGLVAVAPASATISRRGLLGLVGGASLTIFLMQVGQVVGGPFRRSALLAARGRVYGTGPGDFPVTTTARSARITTAMTSGWRLSLAGGGRTMSFTREDLLAMPQHHADITLTCVEGWSTTQHWTGVRLEHLRRLIGASGQDVLRVDSFQGDGPFRRVALSSEQVSAEDALLALQVNGADLTPDHGYPARVIVPGVPGVHNTKWVGALRFTSA